MVTKNGHEVIANAIGTALKNDKDMDMATVWGIVQEIVTALTDDNPRFNPELFIRAIRHSAGGNAMMVIAE